MLKMGRYGTSFNLDGIWGGNMYAGGAGAILPNKITSKHNIRYLPKMNGLEIVKRFREQLDRNGYKDVELKIIGDVPWSKMSYDTDIARAMTQMYDQFNIPHGQPSQTPTILGGYWPAYLFSNQEVGEKIAPVSMPIGMGGAGHGGNAHAANEFMRARRRRQGLRHGRRGEVARGDLLQLRRQERTAPADGHAAQDRMTHGRAALIAAHDITKTYAMEGAPVHALRGVTLDIHARRIRRRRRAVRLRQVDVHAHPRLPRSADERPLPARRPRRLAALATTSCRRFATARSGSCSRDSTCWRAPRRSKTWSCRCCTRTTSRVSPAERRQPRDDGARRGRTARIAPSITPTSCRAASSSASRSRARC